MLIIRFTRTGRKHDPYFRLVIVDSRKSSKSGAYLENLGSYNPRVEEQKFNGERVKYWISQGAQVSDSAFNALINAKIISDKKRKITSASRKKQGEEKTEEKKGVADEEKKGVADNEVGGASEPIQDSGVMENLTAEDNVVSEAPVETREEIKIE